MKPLGDWYNFCIDRWTKPKGPERSLNPLTNGEKTMEKMDSSWKPTNPTEKPINQPNWKTHQPTQL